MRVINLKGIRAETPIGAMAAFGVLRLCEAEGARLGWDAAGGGWHAVLSMPQELSEGDLIRFLISRLPTAAEWTSRDWPEQIKTWSVSDFRKRGEAALSTGSRSEAEWIAAFGSELAQDDGVLESTPFDMSVARQKFLADANRLANGLAIEQRSKKQKTQFEEYREALFGPWRYQDDQHSLGWDPATVKLGAFTYKAPSQMPNTGVRAAVWLAFESLPLFPVFAKGRHQRTRAFVQGRRETRLFWPVWNAPISLDELRSLLAYSELFDSAASARLSARGVQAVYSSQQFKPNKYMVTFRPAELAYSRTP